MTDIRSILQRVSREALLRSLACFVALSAQGASPEPSPSASAGKVFATPEAAVAALADAVATTNHVELQRIFGPAGRELVNPDEGQAASEFATFAAAFGETHRVVRGSETRCVLEVGHGLWPFPVPIIRTQGGWIFDSPSGREELINRRIGANELGTVNALRAYVQAQREYASRDRDDDGVLEYAQNFLSTPGNQDGLYWSPDAGGEVSPLGPLVAAAQSEGFRMGSGERSGPRPFHGYLFRILTRQGEHAPGGRYGYVINGNMIGGFALVAWPANYGETGIMTFLVNHQGRVYQSDLGPKTARTVRTMKAYEPGKAWMVSPE